MGISDQLQKLDELRRQGALSDEEFVIAKQKVLAEPADVGADDRLADLQAQTEVLQLDRAWELERENYMVTSRYGHRFIPSKGSSVLGGGLMVAFGAVWIVMVFSITSMGPPGPISLLFPLFGVFFVLFGIVQSIRAFNKATEYEQAFANYQKRRQQLISPAGRVSDVSR